MIIKTLRDAELALNKLEREMNGLLSKAQTPNLSLDDVRRLISQAQLNRAQTQTIFQNTSQFDLTDIDATPSEGQILHRLIHLFFSEVRFAKSIRLADGWFSTLDGLRLWKTNIGFDNPVGGSDPNYQIQWLDSVTPALNYRFFLDPTLGICLDGSIIPLTNATGDLGNSTLLWRNLLLGGNITQSNESSRGEFFSDYYNATAGTANIIRMRRARGTRSAPADVQIGDRLGTIAFMAYRGGAFLNTNYWDNFVVSLPGASAVAVDTTWVTTDTAGITAGRWVYKADGHFQPVTDNTVDLGSATERVRKLWVVDIDFSGTIAGTLPATDANTSVSANASASPTLTTSFADLSGASVTLDKNGTWLITANIVGSKELNDDEIQAQYVYDGSAVAGIIRMAASSATFMRSTGSRSWRQVVTGQPKTAKLQVKKNAGTGFSTVDATNSNITAVFLTT